MMFKKAVVAASLTAFALAGPACDKKEEAKKEDAKADKDKKDDAKKDDAKE
jgi:hypothetical protein